MINSGISICIPVFNQDATIGATIESVLQQRVAADEIIVSENHSTDRTSLITTKFGDRIRSVQPPTHLSMSENWNFAVSHVKTPWFTVLSGDDIALPNYIEGLLRATRIHNCSLIRGRYFDVDQTGKIQRWQKLARAPTIIKFPYNVYEQMVGPRVGFAAFAARTSAWRAVGGFPLLNCYGDWAFWLKLAPTGSFVAIKDTIAHYRKGYTPTLKDERAFGELEDEFTIAVSILPSVAESAFDSSVLRRARRWRLQYYLYIHDYKSRLFERADAIALVEKWGMAADGMDIVAQWRLRRVTRPLRISRHSIPILWRMLWTPSIRWFGSC